MREHIRQSRRLWTMPIVIAVLVLAAVGCVSTGGDSFEEFRAALRDGASCNELFDQRANFDDPDVLERIDRAMDEVGCERRESTRSDI